MFLKIIVIKNILIEPWHQTRKEIDLFMESSAPGSNPAVPVAVDSFDQAGTPSLCRASHSILRRKK